MSQKQLDQLQPDAVAEKANKFGLQEAAKKLHTSKSSLSRWLKGKGYKAKPQYMKVDDEGREPIAES